ncbi:helix-turn-helix domain-containing protein [Flavobacterium sp. W1B]|uniref:helix-turn-helix domain-containing protein n=1 Tax=Flavobacterium sp. W1B TaxID=3394146 RepID=UPI0039BC2E3F
MEKLHNQQRIISIRLMLFQMAKGNFNIRIPVSSYDDELEALVVLLNMVAEEMSEAIFHSGYVNSHQSHQSYQFSTQFSFVLDKNYYIKNINKEVVELLGYSEKEVLNKPLTFFLTPDSIAKIAFARELLSTSSYSQAHVAISFVSKEKLLVSANCTIILLLDDTATILNGLSSFSQAAVLNLIEPDREASTEKQPGTRKTDACIVQQLYDYILQHLDEPLPPLKTLSKLFSTNEYKLKDGFRHFFRTSIYQFYNEERLKRSHLMVKESNIPLKNIAHMNGFADYSNFSKSFKRRFGYSPNELKRSPKISYLQLDNSLGDN